MRSPPRFSPTTAAGLDAKEADPRRKTAIGLSQLADLYATAPDEVMPNTLALIGEKLSKESDPEIQSLLGAAFARFGQEACTRKKVQGDRRTLLLARNAWPSNGPPWCRIFAPAWASKIACPR